METRKEKREGKPVSLLGFGAMRLPCIGGQDDAIDFAAAQEMIDLAYKSGVNYFDTAYPYHKGKSELFLGQALEQYPRDSFFLADKMPSWALKEEGDVRRVFEEQLEKCRVDHFDFYLCHNVSKDTLPNFQKFGVIEYLAKEKEAGRIKRLGFSFHDKPALLEQVVGLYDWDFAQLQLNYLDWTMQDAKRQYEILTEHGIPVIVMEPVRGGALASLTEEAAAPLLAAAPGKSIASWAVRFAASLPNVLTVLSGMTTLEQVKDNIATMEHFEPLTDAGREMLLEAAKKFHAEVTVPCTGCRYCMDCPSGVDIPAVFRAYNAYMLGKNQMTLRMNYGELPQKARAGSCVGCRACAPHCPQGIDIPARLEMIAKTVEPLL